MFTIEYYIVYCTLWYYMYICTLYGMALYMYTDSKITHSNAILPEDVDGVDIGVAAITIILMLIARIYIQVQVASSSIQCKPMY